MTLVSIIIPTYNRADLIERSVKSVLNQTYDRIELIVVDDGSTDNTVEVLQDYIQSEKIRYVKKENGGCASARNRGISEATGTYLAFLDSDDTYRPDAIKNLADALSNSDADFVFSPVIEIYPDQREVKNYPVAKDHPENFAAEHLVNTNVYIHACLFNRDILNREQMDESMHYNEDSDFLQRVAINFRAVYCPEPTVNHYHHHDNKSKNRLAILNALLYSLNKVRLNYPAFYSAHKKAADKRSQMLNKLLLKQHILNKDYTSAKDISKAINTNIFIQTSLIFKSKYPVKLGNILGMC